MNCFERVLSIMFRETCRILCQQKPSLMWPQLSSVLNEQISSTSSRGQTSSVIYQFFRVSPPFKEGHFTSKCCCFYSSDCQWYQNRVLLHVNILHDLLQWIIEHFENHCERVEVGMALNWHIAHKWSSMNNCCPHHVEMIIMIITIRRCTTPLYVCENREEVFFI